MSPAEFIEQIERPYWSPHHPQQYIQTAERGGAVRRWGWGVLWPNNIGAFNLVWLLSGVGGPPDSYGRFNDSTKWAQDHAEELFFVASTKHLSTAADVARRPLAQFAQIFRAQSSEVRSRLSRIEGALAVRL